MLIINIHEAEMQLSRLVDQAANGEPFIIVKAGKPLVKVSRLDAPPDSTIHRLGFMAGQMRVLDDFDQMGNMEIEQLFGGGK